MTTGYSAGIFDGEGCIVVAKNKCKTVRGYQHQLHVIVNNNDGNLINYLYDNYGGSKFPVKVNDYYTYYRWVITSHKAGEFLKIIYPHLISKKKEADVAFKFLDTFNGYQHVGVPEDIFLLRELYHKELKKLKRPWKYL